MSKAFTRESDGSSPEETLSPRPQLPTGARNYITREGAERLKQQLNELLERKRAFVAGSSNETGAAPEAERQKIESAIRKIRQILESVVLAEIPSDRDRIAFGATVMIRRGNADEEAYQIVGVEEADPERGRISWISPLARALLSRRAGEKVHFRTPGGDGELTIITVRY